MKIILSPTKQMKISEYFEAKTHPLFEDKAKNIQQYLLSLDDEQYRKVINANDKIVQNSHELLEMMDFEHQLTPAIFSYDGIAFKYIAPDVLDDESLNFLQDHLLILSGMYGALRCFDGINLYRLEMGAKLKIDQQSLYSYHQEVNDLFDEDELIINLASKEYSQLINHPMVEVIFYCEDGSGKRKIKATIAKMARGSMVRYIAENKIEDIAGLKKFNLLDFSYCDELSNTKQIVFIKKEK